MRVVVVVSAVIRVVVVVSAVAGRDNSLYLPLSTINKGAETVQVTLIAFLAKVRIC